MRKENKNPTDTSLRQKAEDQVIKKRAGKTEPLAESESVKLLHELEVYQVELEMQNEELRMARDKSEAATEKITMLYDFAPAGYFTLDYDGLITELNLNGAKMLCKERGALIKTHFKNFVSPDTRNIFQEFYRKVLETGLKHTCEVRLTTQYSTPCYVHLTGIISEDKQNYLITAIDITGLKLAEEALKESATRLQELNATKDKFFSIIAHDLRGPFTAIIGFAELLMDRVKVKKYEGIEKYAEVILESSRLAMNLLRNLLEWARLQTGKIKFNPQRIEMTELINEVTELLKESAQQKSITISKELAADITIFADREMTSNVLRNLVSNAIKFTNPGGNITISVQHGQDEMMVIVSDNGVGIRKDNIKKLFLIEGVQSTKGTQNEEGTGLGLILCKEFISMHSGKIWAESDPGKGSSFYFTIPKNLNKNSKGEKPNK